MPQNMCKTNNGWSAKYWKIWKSPEGLWEPVPPKSKINPCHEEVMLYSASSKFWRSIFPIFGQEKDEFLTKTVRTFFDENNLNKLYIRICFQISNQLFCLLLKLLPKHILIHSFKNYLPHILTYMRMKLPMMAIKYSQTANDSHLKHLLFKYKTLVLIWNHCKYQNFLVTGIVYSQRIIYINIHKYSTQLKSISVVVISYISLFCDFK